MIYIGKVNTTPTKITSVTILVVSTNVQFLIGQRIHLFEGLLSKGKVFCMMLCLPREFPCHTSPATVFACSFLSLCAIHGMQGLLFWVWFFLLDGRVSYCKIRMVVGMSMTFHMCSELWNWDLEEPFCLHWYLHSCSSTELRAASVSLGMSIIAFALYLSYLFLKFFTSLFMAWLLEMLKIHKLSWMQLKLLEYNWKT